MGYSSWDNASYNTTRCSYTNATMDEIFVNNKTRQISPQMSPFDLKIRESRDSDIHPNSFASLVFLDVTGSMGSIPKKIVQEKLGSIMNTLVDLNFPDIQVLFGAIGDHKHDQFPIQIGQFETGPQELNRWLTETYIEGGGGGGSFESYLLAWYFAQHFTSIDCFENRNKKGILFTVGDERTYETISGNSIKKIFGNKEVPPQEVSAKDLLKEIRKNYEPYHIHVNTTSYRNNEEVLNSWRNLIGENNLLILNDDSAVAEIISTVIGLHNEIELESILSKFDSDMQYTISETIKNVKIVTTNSLENLM